MLKKYSLFFFILLYFLLFSFISFNKYFSFSYNALDLAIFNQVFYSSSLGNIFSSSIHDPTYLGDHVSPILLILLPLYYLWKSPLNLLIIQTLFLALSAIPLYLIAKNVFKNSLIPLFVSLAFLLNPFIQNINLFEFELLNLSIFFLFFSFYFYQIKKFFPFFLFLILSLLVREDVSFIIFFFSFLPWGERKKYSLKWILTPLFLSIFSFFLSWKIINYYAESYKFLVYYSWLGDSLWEMMKNFLIRFDLVIKHFLTLGNLEMILGFLFPFLFLPLLRPKYLLLSLAPFLQIILMNQGGNHLILQTHYASLFLPSLFISSVYGLERLTRSKNKLFIFLKKETFLSLTIFFLTLVYSTFTLGPLPYVFKKTENIDLKNEFVNFLDKQSSVMASYDFLPHLSSRENLYSLNYLFLGKKQYSKKDYSLPLNTEYLLIDASDFLTYGLQYKNLGWTSSYYPTGDNRLREILKDFGLIKIQDDLMLFKRKSLNKYVLYKTHVQDPMIGNKLKINLNNEIEFLGWEKKENYFSFFWKPLSSLNKDYQLKIEFIDNLKVVKSKFYPLAYGFYPTSEWGKEIVQTNYWFPRSKESRIRVGLVEIEGQLQLDRRGSTAPFISYEKQIGKRIILKE